MFTALVPRAAAFAQSDVLWRRTMGTPINYFRLDARGHLLLMTDEGITALSPDSGATAWRYAIRDSITVLRALSSTRLLVAGGQTMAVLDVVTGEPAWRRIDLPDLGNAWVDASWRDSLAIVQTRNGFVVIDLLTGTNAWDSTALPAKTVVRDFYRLPVPDLLLVVAKTQSNAATLMGVSKASGLVRWSDPAMFRSEVTFKRKKGVEYLIALPPLPLPDSTVVVYFSPEGPIRVDPRTGQVIWRSQALAGLEVPSFVNNSPWPDVLDSLVVVPTERRVVALDLATGQVRWSTRDEFPGPPHWLAVGTSAVVVGSSGPGSSFYSVIGADGVRRGPADQPLHKGAWVLPVADTLFAASGDTLYAIPLETGIARALAPIGFEGDESPMDIDSLEGGGILLSGRQNLVRINRDGTVVYRRYYPAPGSSFGDIFAGLVTALALGAMIQSPSYAWSAQAVNYVDIFTARPDSAGRKGFSLVVLDRRDGRELGRMWFNERHPRFLIDHRSAMVYEIEEQEVIARRFQGLPVVTEEPAVPRE